MIKKYFSGPKTVLIFFTGLALNIPAALYRDMPLKITGHMILHVLDLVGTCLTLYAMLDWIFNYRQARGLQTSLTTPDGITGGNDQQSFTPQQPSVPHRGEFVQSSPSVMPSQYDTQGGVPMEQAPVVYQGQPTITPSPQPRHPMISDEETTGPYNPGNQRRQGY
jgi:hypothetical protein